MTVRTTTWCPPDAPLAALCGQIGERMKKPLPISLHLNADDFIPADPAEKQSLVIMRESVSFWQDGARRLLRNKVAMVSAAILLIIIILAFIVPVFYP